MTMDYGNSPVRSELKMSSPRISAIDSPNQTNIDLTTTKSATKRAFDVAFLMRPDEKTKHKQSRLTASSDEAIVTYPVQHQPPSPTHRILPNHISNPHPTLPQHQISVKSDEALRRSVDSNDDHQTPSPRYFADQTSSNNNNNAVEVINHNTLEAIRMSRYAIYNQHHANRLPRIYDDPSIDITGPYGNTKFIDDPQSNQHHHPKSAFTKVPSQHSIVRSDSPIPSSSPDQLSCPSSSPPVSVSPPRHANNIIYQNFRPAEYRHFVNAAAAGHQFHTIHQLQQAAAANHSHKFKQQFLHHRNTSNGVPPSNQHTPDEHHQSAHNFMPNNAAPPHFGVVHPHQHFGGGGTPNGHPGDLSGLVRNPAAAAALLTSLIPPTIATSFTLTAQNVCAKCNISFRMTSDLVYHMRSHHKSEYPGGDTNRRKREEKLKCPVCNESFRERHHLTRHMTAHQDKASDETPIPTENGHQIHIAGSHAIHRSRHMK